MQDIKKEFPDHLRETILVTPPPRFPCGNCNAQNYVNEHKPETWDIGVFTWGEGYMVEMFAVLCTQCKTPIFTMILTVAAKLEVQPETPKSQQVTPRQVPVIKTPATPPPIPRKWTALEILAGKHREGK